MKRYWKRGRSRQLLSYAHRLYHCALFKRWKPKGISYPVSSGGSREEGVGNSSLNREGRGRGAFLTPPPLISDALLLISPPLLREKTLLVGISRNDSRLRQLWKEKSRSGSKVSGGAWGLSQEESMALMVRKTARQKVWDMNNLQKFKFSLIQFGVVQAKGHAQEEFCTWIPKLYV